MTDPLIAAATREPIVSNWSDRKVADFGAAPLELEHSLHHHPLFSQDALCRLLERLSPADYQLNTMDIARHDSSSRREGEIGNLSGEQVLQAVRNGRIWILVMHPQRIEPGYGDLLETVYAEFARKVTGFRPYLLNMAILISSPNVQVYYHCDIPGQMLWQISGHKRIYIYPNREPFLDQRYLERVALGEAHECGLPYEPGFDQHAVVYDLQPGRMLHWPLNAPHRIVNGDCLNVSFATEHFTRSLRRHYYVNCANGVLRSRSGLANLSQRTSGPSYWAKFGVAAAWKLTGAHRKHKRTPNIEFAVDPGAPYGVRPLRAHDTEASGEELASPSR